MPSYNILNHYIGNNGFIHLRNVQSSDSFKSFPAILYHILPLMYHVHSQIKIIISIIASPETFLSFYSLYYCSYLAIAANKRFLSIDLFFQPPLPDISVSFPELRIYLCVMTYPHKNVSL